MNRRKTLALLGGGFIAAAGAGVAGFSLTRTPHQALAPRTTAGNYEDVRLFALSYAILAPNPHNLQPWLVELVGDTRIILHRDKSRELPQTDPFQRQLVIGLGCFLELMVIAAAERGVGVALDIFPQGDAGPVAIADFGGDVKPDTLFSQIPLRQTNRNPHEVKPLSGKVVTALSQKAILITEDRQVQTLRALTWAASEIEMNTEATHHESINLTRIGKAEINANPDGISLGGPFLEGLAAMGMLTREGQMDPNSSEFASFGKFYHEMLINTQAYAVINTDGNNRADQITAGRRWVRLNLATTALGLALQPVSQALQEYPEMAEKYAEVHRLLAEDGQTVQMLGRMGYAKGVRQSPRWPLETRLLNG